jgi:hypothetical protein
MPIEPLKPMFHPRWIRKDGELFEYAESKPGWLVYENAKHFVLVGRSEAQALAVEDLNARVLPPQYRTKP